MPKRRRKHRRLGQESNIDRFYAIRRHLREASNALDRKRCMDAAMHLHEARDLMKPRFDPGTETRTWYEDEKARLQASCRLSFAAYKPEKIPRHARLTPGAEARARRSAKKAATRVARRAAKRDPEGASPYRITRGYID